jgi:hypothetical protein
MGISSFRACGSCADAVLLNRIDGVLDALAGILSKAEVVVGAQVEGWDLFSGVLKCSQRR